MPDLEFTSEERSEGIEHLLGGCGVHRPDRQRKYNPRDGTQHQANTD
jgi:hypothetical protein